MNGSLNLKFLSRTLSGFLKECWRSGRDNLLRKRRSRELLEEQNRFKIGPPLLIWGLADLYVIHYWIHPKFPFWGRMQYIIRSGKKF
jgi:hypothetical protein